MNKVTIEPTEFINIRSGSKTLGVRVYDDNTQAYDNNWEEIPINDLDVLEKVLELDNDEISIMLDFVKENKMGIDIGGTWYEWEEIKDCFSF
jgi:hypothetical protein